MKREKLIIKKLTNDEERKEAVLCDGSERVDSVCDGETGKN